MIKNLTGHDYWGICGSLGVHIGLISLLLGSVGVVKSHVTDLVQSESEKHTTPSIIQAVALDRELVTQELKKLEYRAKQDVQHKKQLIQSQAKLRTEQKKLNQEKSEVTKLKSELELLKKQTEKQSDLLTQEQQKLKKTLELQESQAKTLADQMVQQKLAQKNLEQLAQKAQAEHAQQLAQAYVLKIQNKIKNNHQYLLHLPSDLKTEITFFLTASGHIKNLRVSRSSGSESYDQSTVIAVQKSIPFEMPEDPLARNQLNREIILGFTNEHAG